MMGNDSLKKVKNGEHMSDEKKSMFFGEPSPGRVKRSPETGLKRRLRKLVGGQSFCILCTQGEGQPYGSLIAYAFSRDLKHFYFTTARPTRKFRLLSECDRVALVIDSRCQHPEQITDVEAVTVTGRAGEIRSGRAHQRGLRKLTDRHPYLARFLKSESTALFQIDVVRYIHVTRFQEVSQWIP